MRLRYKAVMLLMGALMAVTLAGLACGGSDEPSTDTPAPEPTETLPTGNTVPLQSLQSQTLQRQTK